jgi:hypothetical protein
MEQRGGSVLAATETSRAAVVERKSAERLTTSLTNYHLSATRCTMPVASLPLWERLQMK